MKVTWMLLWLDEGSDDFVQEEAYGAPAMVDEEDERWQGRREKTLWWWREGFWRKEGSGSELPSACHGDSGLDGGDLRHWRLGLGIRVSLLENIMMTWHAMWQGY
ncbi:hypothetical protein LR48_Vigan10g180500 [Vigna angularis]|uniref:Uncharacterized protein n=1 Tax=Phaseolus angularis TaxID=3914 RepID=A0A0L9VLP7_PHAAN|nr:hypothetical protein LR48_Vigan10g180500 [Vigna angularis]